MLPKSDNSESPALNEYREDIMEMHVDRKKLERTLMDYVLAMGCAETAVCFAEESPMVSSEMHCGDAASVFVRTLVRDAIHSGECKKAIELIEEFSPEALLIEPYIRFPLYLQQLIEYIRKEDFDEAIQLAQNNMYLFALREKKSPFNIRDRLERAMALLAFRDPDKSAFNDVFSPEHRRLIADELNNMILNLFDGTGMGGSPGCWERGFASGKSAHMNNTKLMQLYKLCEWGQTTLTNKRVSFIKMENVENLILKEIKRN
ncbi:hypothetical protein GJ496_004766 [Pomphorhynchus laevis]|nr:hypothetical protein GJ496_004766 [Pomphorhynchus laevis]